MTITPIGYATAPVPSVARSGSSPQQGLGTMSPEMILFMMRKRMNDLDGQISTITAGIDRATSQAGAISRKLEVLQAIKKAASARDNHDIWASRDPTGGHPEEQAVVLDGQDAGPFGDVMYLNEHYGLNLPVEGDAPDKVVRGDAIDAAIDETKQELQDANSGNELDMVKLQSTMQQRQEIISLGTNLLKTLNDADQNVVRNIGA